MRASLTIVALLAVSPALAGGGDLGFSRGGERFVERAGEALYWAICQGCHMPDARGATAASTYPSLAVNVRLTNAGYPALVVLAGRCNMPAFAASLDDAQVAAVVGASARISATRMRTSSPQYRSPRCDPRRHRKPLDPEAPRDGALRRRHGMHGAAGDPASAAGLDVPHRVGG